MDKRDYSPRPLLKMALRCPNCHDATLRPIGEGSKMVCPDCGYETPKGQGPDELAEGGKDAK
jgi:hypothetical protein